MKLMLIALLMLPASAFAQTSDCACINRNGVEVPLGQVACLTVGGQSFLARCAMSQNVLTWRKLQDGCPAATLNQSRLQPDLPHSTPQT